MMFQSKFAMIFFKVQSHYVWCYFGVFQSLVFVFAQLIHTQLEAVLEFLYSVPDPQGKPALEFVLAEWCSKQHLFYGAYEGKVR